MHAAHAEAVRGGRRARPPGRRRLAPGAAAGRRAAHHDAEHRRRAAEGSYTVRTGHEDAKPIDDVAEVPEGRHVSEHEVDAGEGDRRSRYRARDCALLLGSLDDSMIVTVCLGEMSATYN